MKQSTVVAVLAAALWITASFADEARIGNWHVMQKPLDFAEKVSAVGRSDSTTWAVTKSGEVVREEYGEVEAFGKVQGQPQLVVAAEDSRKSAAIVNDAGEVYLVSENRPLMKLHGELPTPVADVAFNLSGKPVILDEAGRIYVADGQQLREPADSRLAVPRALFPNGEFVAGVGDNGMLLIKTTAGLHLVQSLPSRIVSPAAIGLSPDSRFLVVADKATPLVELWDLASQRLVKSLTIPSDLKVRITTSHSAEFIVSVDASGKAYFTDIDNGETVQHRTLLTSDGTASTTKTLSLGNGSVVSVSPDGKVEELTMGIAAQAGPPRKYVSVPVYYATNRDRSAPPSFLFAALSFLWSLSGLLGLIVAAVLLVATFMMRWRNSRIAWAIFGVMFAIGMVGIGLDRGARFDPDTKHRYGAELGELKYGECTVTVPQRRQIGELNSPFSFWVIHFPEDPEAHVVLKKVEELSVQTFQERLSGHAAAARKSAEADGTRDDALLFIHGYNVTFEDAVRRTAQLSVDLQFTGPAMCFTWPSYGEAPAYTWDVTNAENSVLTLQAMLKELNANEKLRRVHIIAHSMGNRVLTKALTQDGLPDLNAEVFREIVLAAPDVDRTLFVQQIAPKFRTTRQHVTLYASSCDNALVMSKLANGAQRAGDTQPSMTICDAIDSIDATAVDTSLLGHSYFSDERSIVDDLHYLLGNGLRPQQRFALERQDTDEGVYWRIRP